MHVMLVIFHFITGCEVASARVNGNWLCQREMATFDLCRIDTPQPITKTFVKGDYGVTPTAVPNLVHIIGLQIFS